MNVFLICMALTICCVLKAFGGWNMRGHTPNEYAPYTFDIVYVPESGDFATFGEALDQMKTEGYALQLKSVGLQRYNVYNPGFQEEVFAALEKIAPAQLAKARSWRAPGGAISVDALRQAVSATPSVQQINAELAPLGLRVTQVVFGEKSPRLVREENQLRMAGLVWLEIGKGNALPVPAAAVAQCAENVIVSAARSQIGKTVAYAPEYVRLAYPMGDIPLKAYRFTTSLTGCFFR